MVRGVEPGTASDFARSERAVALNEIEAVDVDVFEIEAPADVVIQQGDLEDHFTEGVPDSGVEPRPVVWPARVSGWHGINMICIP